MPSPSNAESLRESLLYQCLRIRMVEEKIIELYPTDQIQSPVHLSIGQEAVAVGVCAHLRRDDWVFINYRGHAFYLAKGGPLPAFFAELMGRRDGLSKGKAGSMHLAAPDCGVIGASAVVASSISHAVGAALASKIRGETGRVFVANFGDGAMEQGVFHESLNFAALHQVPVLFLCEDNGLAVHTSCSARQAFSVRRLIEAYGIAYYELKEGYDPENVRALAGVAIEKVRQEQCPVFIKVHTARYREHVGPGEDFHAGYRSEAEMNAWKAKDPLMQSSSVLDSYRAVITTEIEAALQMANASPLPTLEDLLTDVL
ncbi:MAG: thiamine pyrophosphate-dependent dehydrogenase E1 component subunit alpha [Candidatus Sericytochromatia bacterium]|nr:thiamine pyrophosphate-dependent dehydrogenase E1 component subunit alpha [Candidatus Sericytochromatia bacterium]